VIKSLCRWQSNAHLLELIDQEYTRHPFYGSRKIMPYLRNEGYKINRKRVQRLMRRLGLAGMAPGPNTSKPHPEHKIYPYLLRGVDVTKPNQVWSTDITYLRLPKGFMYLVASSTGILGKYSPGGYRTQWKAPFALTVCKRLYGNTGLLKSSILIRVLSLRVPPLSGH
jgi:transposase InsO family protein